MIKHKNYQFEPQISQIKHRQVELANLSSQITKIKADLKINNLSLQKVISQIKRIYLKIEIDFRQKSLKIAGYNQFQNNFRYSKQILERNITELSKLLYGVTTQLEYRTSELVYQEEKLSIWANRLIQKQQQLMFYKKKNIEKDQIIQVLRNQLFRVDIKIGETIKTDRLPVDSTRNHKQQKSNKKQQRERRKESEIDFGKNGKQKDKKQILSLQSYQIEDEFKDKELDQYKKIVEDQNKSFQKIKIKEEQETAFQQLQKKEVLKYKQLKDCLKKEIQQIKQLKESEKNHLQNYQIMTQNEKNEYQKYRNLKEQQRIEIQTYKKIQEDQKQIIQSYRKMQDDQKKEIQKFGIIKENVLNDSQNYRKLIENMKIDIQKYTKIKQDIQIQQKQKFQRIKKQKDYKKEQSDQEQEIQLKKQIKELNQLLQQHIRKNKLNQNNLQLLKEQIQKKQIEKKKVQQQRCQFREKRLLKRQLIFLKKQLEELRRYMNETKSLLNFQNYTHSLSQLIQTNRKYLDKPNQQEQKRINQVEQQLEMQKKAKDKLIDNYKQQIQLLKEQINIIKQKANVIQQSEIIQHILRTQNINLRLINNQLLQQIQQLQFFNKNQSKIRFQQRLTRSKTLCKFDQMSTLKHPHIHKYISQSNINFEKWINPNSIYSSQKMREIQLDQLLEKSKKSRQSLNQLKEQIQEQKNKIKNKKKNLY